MLWNGSQPVFSHLLKNVLPHMGVYCGKRVVEKVEVFVGVHSPGEWSNTQEGYTEVSPGQVYPLLLAATQVNSLFANLGAIATSQLSQVGLQSACLQHLGKKTSHTDPMFMKIPFYTACHWKACQTWCSPSEFGFWSMPVEPQKQPLLSHLQPPQYDPSRQAMQRGGKTFRNPPRRPKWVI